MPSLQEYYDADVKLHGADSKSAKMLKQQLDNEAYSKGRSAERTFVAGGGPTFQTLDKAD